MQGFALRPFVLAILLKFFGVTMEIHPRASGLMVTVEVELGPQVWWFQ